VHDNAMTTEEMLYLKRVNLAPYIQLATALVGKSRYGGSNMFRHQLDTMAVLIDYGYLDSVLLKAAIVHDLLEDVPDFNHNVLLLADYEGHVVYELVQEVTRVPSVPKHEFLSHILENGSQNAKVLKVADRISNMVSLGFVNKMDFIKRYTDETETHVFPIAKLVNKSMLEELQSLVKSRRKYFADFEKIRVDAMPTDSTQFL